MTTAALCSMAASPAVPQAHGMLSCLGGFSPRVPSVGVQPSPGRGTLPSNAYPSPGAASLSCFTSPRQIESDLAHIDYDPKLISTIQRKREQEMQRCTNRLTPRMQKIGLDIAALNKQVAEKQSRTEASKGEDAMYLEAMKVKGDLVRQAEEIVQNDRRAQQKECVDFSLQNLRTEQRREFYLNDPNMLKKETPARVPGIVPPMSSMQKFQGELDLDPQKKKERRQNTCDWLAAQVAEKKLKAELEKDLDRQHDEALSRADQYRSICEAAVHQDRHQEVLETARENIAMASARSNRQLSARDRLLAAKTEHMKNVMEHNLIREKHDYSIGLTGRKRDYKRSSYEEECKAWEVNKNLAQAKRDRARHSVDNDGFYSQIGMTFEYLGNLNEAQWMKERLDRRQQIDETNKILAQERREVDRKEKLEYTAFAPSP